MAREESKKNKRLGQDENRLSTRFEVIVLISYLIGKQGRVGGGLSRRDHPEEIKRKKLF